MFRHLSLPQWLAQSPSYTFAISEETFVVNNEASILAGAQLEDACDNYAVAEDLHRVSSNLFCSWIHHMRDCSRWVFGVEANGAMLLIAGLVGRVHGLCDDDFGNGA